MATATYIKGDKRTMNYTCTGAVVVDEVIVLGGTNASPATVAIAQTAGVTGDVIAVEYNSAYTFPAVTGAVSAQGEGVNWDSSAGKVDDTAHTLGAGDVGDFGIALAAKTAATGSTTLDVQLVPGNGVYATS